MTITNISETASIMAGQLSAEITSISQEIQAYENGVIEYNPLKSSELYKKHSDLTEKLNWYNEYDFLANSFKDGFFIYKSQYDEMYERIFGKRSFDYPKLNGYYICDDGIFWIYEDKKGVKKELITTSVMYPSKILHNHETGTEKVEVTFLKNCKLKTIIKPRSELVTNTKIVSLSDYGINVSSENAKTLVKYFSNFFSFQKIKNVVSTEKLGWHGNVFVPYDEKVYVDNEENLKPLMDAIDESGTFEDWVNYVKPFRDNIYVRLTLASSFASVLIQKLHANPFVFHLWGKTSGGKTVALMLGASVWGYPKIGSYIRPIDGTENSMMATSGFLNNLPFIADELQTIKEYNISYDSLIMKLTEGV